jgi:hypothetical protein
MQKLEITACHEQFQADLVKDHRVTQLGHQGACCGHIRKIESDNQAVLRFDGLG